MSSKVLDGLCVIERSAFVAAPLCGMTLAQQGADVIRLDQIGGGLDYRRWPLAKGGQSLYWAGLNKGKRSVQLDLHSAAGRELATALIAAPGSGRGMFLTNLPAHGWLSFEVLRERREDLIMMLLTGNPDGSSEVDYTVNSAAGFPSATGSRGSAAPLNSVLPAWDIAMGTLGAVGMLAAERRRSYAGGGQLVRLALSDVAFAMVGNLGRIAQAELGTPDEGKDGNYLYGAFGHDFETRDRRRVMVVAITGKQWAALREATGIGAACQGIEGATMHEFGTETGRFEARELIAALLRSWFSSRDLSQVREAFAETSVCWGPYQTFQQLVSEDPRCSSVNPMFEELEQPGIGTYLTPGSPLSFASDGRLPARRAPVLGEHTEEVLADVLDLGSGEIGRLFDAGVVAGPERAAGED